MNETIVKKLTSGKFWLTIIAGFTFAYATYARILDSAAVGVIVTAVFLSYFSKEKNEKPTS